MGRGRKAIVKIALPEDKQERLTRWVTVKKTVDEVKNEEHQLRMAIVADTFSTDKLNGSETVDIGWGYKLKATKRVNYTLINDNGELMNLLSAAKMKQPDLDMSGFTWKPDVSNSLLLAVMELAKVHPELNPLLSGAISIKPGMPELEMIPPKPVQAEIVIDEPDGGKTVTDGSDIQY